MANKINRLKKKEYVNSLIREKFINSLRAFDASIVHDRAFVDMWRKHAVSTVKRNLKGGYPRPYVKCSSLSAEGGRRHKDRNRPVRWLRNRIVIVTSEGRYRLAV